MRTFRSTWIIVLMCAVLILGLSGCASQIARPASPSPDVPINLKRECPKPPVPRDSSAPATLQAYLQALRLYRICADRQKKLAQATDQPKQ